MEKWKTMANNAKLYLFDDEGNYIQPSDEPIELTVVKHGRWIVKGQDIYCSVCGEESAYTWHGSSKFSNYCPNCGAKMDGGEDG